jgi:hypothetical protein
MSLRMTAESDVLTYDMLNYNQLVYAECLQSVLTSWRMLQLVTWDDDAIRHDWPRMRTSNIIKRNLRDIWAL